MIRRYDRPHTFFYLDPPHYGMKVYRLNFEGGDFVGLASLQTIKGKFIMSLNDHDQVSRVFAGSKIEPTALRYSCMREPESRRATEPELLVSCNN